MLDEKGIDYEYREYRKEPLTESELKDLFRMLGQEPRELLRARDRANRDLGLDGSEPAKELIAAMARHPTLLQRPIGVRGERAVVGRPPEKLLELVD